MKIYRKKSSGSGGGYEPDNITINLTSESKLEVDADIIATINGDGTEITVSDAVTITQELAVNKVYLIDADTSCTTLTLTLGTKASGKQGIYSAYIKCGATPPTFTTISGVTWMGTFSLTANKTTYISIENGFGIFSAL